MQKKYNSIWNIWNIIEIKQLLSNVPILYSFEYSFKGAITVRLPDTRKQKENR